MDERDEEVRDDGPEEAVDLPVFDNLGLSPKLLEALKKIGFEHPTPIQFQAIPAVLEGQDVVGIAQTGTGKTLAFGLPMMQLVARKGGKGLVVLPTRELALQVDEMLKTVGRQFGLRTAILIGGASMDPQRRDIANRPHIVIGTPGRIIDHLEQRTLNLGDVSILVLDEADRMLDMGFLPQIRRILNSVPTQRQTMLFSATMPDAIMNIAGRYMKTPVRVEVARAGTPTELVDHGLYVVQKDQKNRLLERMLADHAGSVLVFSRTKFGARRICRAVQGMGHTAAEIHSDRSLAQRREALDGFKSGKYRVLVATDIAARGIDVCGIELVINYDIPENPEDYVHRIGRTGRAGAKGKAITFAMPDQGEEVQQIEMLTQILLPISSLPELPPDRRPPRSEGDSRFGRDDRHGSRGFGDRRRDGRPGGFGGRGRDSRFGQRPDVRRDARPTDNRPPQAASAPAAGQPAAPTGPRREGDRHDSRRPYDRGRDGRDYQIHKPPPIVPKEGFEISFLEGIPDSPKREGHNDRPSGGQRHHGRPGRRR